MPAKRIPMRKLRDILRLRLQADLTIRQINNSLRLSVGAVQKVCRLAEARELTWSKVEQLDDQALLRLLYPPPAQQHDSKFVIPDWAEMHRELKHKGMTKQLLWEEYTAQYPGRSYRYTQFCFLYGKWQKKQKRSMRQQHKAGEKLFVDYAGPTVPVVCRQSGEIKQAQIFVAVFGASNYSYAEATWTQALPDWLGSHARAFEFFGGVPQMVVPDNLKSGVSQACRYDPDLNPSYQQLAAHYDTAIVPARPYKPKDKAKAEVGVQIVERWILARLRHHTFFSLAQLNRHIRTLLHDLNLRPFKQFDGHRQQWFEQIDKPALKPLPKHRYEYTEIKQAKVNIDYHIQFEQHLYSVPHHLVGERVEIHATEHVIEVRFRNTGIASHARRYHRGMTTVPAHMPTGHAQHQQWSSGRIMNWAKDIGDDVLHWVQAQLQQREHEQQAYRVCLGLLQLSRTTSAAHLNRACALANQHSLYRLKQVKALLKQTASDPAIVTDDTSPILPQHHENIRGPASFQ